MLRDHGSLKVMIVSDVVLSGLALSPCFKPVRTPDTPTSSKVESILFSV